MTHTLVMRRPTIPAEIVDGLRAARERSEAFVSQAISEHRANAAREYERALREDVRPVVRGELTAGKLRWRGIRRVYEQATRREWLEQRGQRISAIIEPVRFVV